MNIAAEILLEKANIRDNKDFYTEQFDSSQKLYSEMDADEQKEFRDTVRTNYDAWLGLNEEICDANPRIYEFLTEWLQHQLLITYLSNIATAIIEAGKSKNIPVSQDIKDKNNAYIKELDDEQNMKTDMLEDFGRASKLPGSKMRF